MVLRCADFQPKQQNTGFLSAPSYEPFSAVMEAASQWVALNANHIKVINVETVAHYDTSLVGTNHPSVSFHFIRVWFWGPPLESLPQTRLRLAGAASSESAPGT